MGIPKQIDAQRDFTAGEIDPNAKRRDDDEFVKKGMRQLSNGRTLNAGGVTNRPGRNLVGKRASQSRDEDVLMAPGVIYRLSFTNVTLKIFDSAGTQVFSLTTFPWTGATLGQIIYAVYLNQIFITFPGSVPFVMTWDGVSAWSAAPFAELVIGNQKRTPFYRMAAKGISIQPLTTTGSGVQINADVGYFTGGMVGTRIRFVGRQILITGVTNGNIATGTIEEPLPGSQSLDFSTFDPTAIFGVGDVVRGSVSGAKGVVFDFVPTNQMRVQLLSLGTTTISTVSAPVDRIGTPTAGELTQAFISSDVVVNAAGSHVIAGASAIGGPLLCTDWDEEVMNTFRGYPRSVAVDQGRLIFSDFPALPGAVAWSAQGVPTDLNVGPNPTDGFLELVPGKNRVLYTMAGPEGSEMVFCDAAIFYIAISATNPLKPGSVSFQKISSDGTGQVQPRAVGNVIVFADGGLNQLQAIIATGAYYRPFEVQNLTDLHSHLFNNIQAIALPTSVTQFPERYAYVLNGDGTLVLGKYALDKDSQVAGKIGWLPWNGFGAVKWVSALNDAVIFCTAYTQGGTTAFMIEQLDATKYLDAELPVNAIPPPLTPPGGKGPLWWLPLATVDLIDQRADGALPLGPHATDANGFLIPNYPGEDLTSATLCAGFTWTAIWEPFMPDGQPGQDVGQRMKKRRAYLRAYVMNSSGFRFVTFFNGERGPNRPAPGAIVGDKRIAAYNQDDDATQPPPLREQSYAYKPLGRSYDPRNAIMKDTPGPLTLPEIAARISV